MLGDRDHVSRSAHTKSVQKTPSHKCLGFSYCTDGYFPDSPRIWSVRGVLPEERDLTVTPGDFRVAFQSRSASSPASFPAHPADSQLGLHLRFGGLLQGCWAEQVLGWCWGPFAIFTEFGRSHWLGLEKQHQHHAVLNGPLGPKCSPKGNYCDSRTNPFVQPSGADLATSAQWPDQPGLTLKGARKTVWVWQPPINAVEEATLPC